MNDISTQIEVKRGQTTELCPGANHNHLRFLRVNFHAVVAEPVVDKAVTA